MLQKSDSCTRAVVFEWPWLHWLLPQWLQCSLIRLRFEAWSLTAAQGLLAHRKVAAGGAGVEAALVMSSNSVGGGAMG
jgi:hypothetical protein